MGLSLSHPPGHAGNLCGDETPVSRDSGVNTVMSRAGDRLMRVKGFRTTPQPGHSTTLPPIHTLGLLYSPAALICSAEATSSCDSRSPQPC